MVSLSILGLPGWDNLHGHCQPPANALCRRGEVWQHAWTSPVFPYLVLDDCPVHPRFLVRPRLLTRLYRLPAGRERLWCSRHLAKTPHSCHGGQ
jgi:hypothetical protein